MLAAAPAPVATGGEDRKDAELPEEVTDAMIDAACEAVPDLYRIDAMRALEAAIAASGRDE
jgi:hypothetical protein